MLFRPWDCPLLWSDLWVKKFPPSRSWIASIGPHTHEGSGSPAPYVAGAHFSRGSRPPPRWQGPPASAASSSEPLSPSSLYNRQIRLGLIFHPSRRSSTCSRRYPYRTRFAARSRRRICTQVRSRGWYTDGERPSDTALCRERGAGMSGRSARPRYRTTDRRKNPSWIGQ